MNLSVYIPRDLEQALRRRAKAEKTTPSLFVQRVVAAALDREGSEFSAAFRALPGAWADDRTVDEQIREIKRGRSIRTKRARLR